jgi:hypothetical protein
LLLVSAICFFLWWSSLALGGCRSVAILLLLLSAASLAVFTLRLISAVAVILVVAFALLALQAA